MAFLACGVLPATFAAITVMAATAPCHAGQNKKPRQKPGHPFWTCPMPLSTASRDNVTDVQARPVPRAARRPSGVAAGPQRASLAFMRAHPAHWLALAFGAGLSPLAAGTVGTLWAWLVWALLLAHAPLAVQGGVIAATLALSVWASTVTARHLRTADPGAIVIDEVLAFWLVLWLWTPAGFMAQLAAFALFRFFDAAKPGPVRWADRLLHGAPGWRGGLGIVLDDLVAAFCTLLVLAMWVRWV